MAHRLAVKGAAADATEAALSPRDANAQRLPKAPDLKTTKTAPAVKPQKNKEHPPQPPPEVHEPRSSDRPDGAIYKVGRLLGKGGFAICYDGKLLPSMQKYALKIVKSHMPPKMEQKFQTELQIHSKMRHKNIVQFLRAFAFDSCTFLVLEICPNGSLMDMVKRRKGLTEPEVRFYSVQIAGAIKYMHGKGIIHRDLKMGNIFLDSQMNAKIGDFGLAALLVTGKDMHTIRRTTLCGTPNYIAPEILEKGKTGHDHMVDIWSLGIIVFAMLTSKPPFQSSTTDEIYRRARELDYEWPSVEATQKCISQEAKDLVSSMLQEADRRPQPDVVIEHPFFKSGYMPSEADMSCRLRELPPDGQEFYDHNILTSSIRARSDKNLRDMCRECCIGPRSQVQVIRAPVWKEMAAEEKAGLTPAIPLADDKVYRPFDEWLQEQKEQEEEPLTKIENGIKGLLLQPPQSFAAQQRAQSRPAGATVSGPSRSRAAPNLMLSASQSTRTRVRKEIPREPTIKDLPAVTAKGARETKRPESQLTKSESTGKIADRRSVHKRQESSGSVRSDSIRSASLFSPLEEQSHTIPDTQPDLILDRLRRLQAELERALNSRTMAIISSKTTTPPHPHVVVKWVDYTNKFGLGYILNDGSVGCVLRDIPATDDGRTVMLPPAGVFIRGAERHIMRRQDESYVDRIQPVPMTEQVKFFENNGESGLAEVVVSPDQFRVGVNEDGTAGKMNRGKDVYQHRKRERIILWKKFANYMIAYGRDEAVPVEETDAAAAMSPGQKGTPSELVTFYQRFGDVGCWVYCDGHLQFNFPDHTKIVLDATGTWCHFWHLPKKAAEMLAATSTIGAAALDERAMLSYPLQTLLNFQTKPTAPRSGRTTSSRRRPEIDPELQGVPAANDFRRKVEFIKNVVKEWVANGGLGNSSMGRDRLRWTGYREVPDTAQTQKHVWVTIGARWGDKRLTEDVELR